MRSYGPDKIRNVGLFGHGGSGKTTLTEALLLTAKAVSRAGRVEDGNTVSDFDPDEQRRHMSINLAVAPVEWKDTKINIVDAPGYADFAGDVVSAMRVLDGAIILHALTPAQAWSRLDFVRRVAPEGYITGP